MSKKYKLLIDWGDVEPEISRHTHDTFKGLLKQARRVREIEGDEHGLYYLTWRTAELDTLEVCLFGKAELQGDTK